MVFNFIRKFNSRICKRFHLRGPGFENVLQIVRFMAQDISSSMGEIGIGVL